MQNQTISPNIIIVFHILQDGKPAHKEVLMNRETFLAYNAKPKDSWADLYKLIVADKAYIRITDKGNSN